MTTTQQPSPAIGLRQHRCRLIVIASWVKSHAQWLVDTRRRAAGIHRLKLTIDDDAVKLVSQVGRCLDPTPRRRSHLSRLFNTLI